jgi:hypothetical protein
MMAKRVYTSGWDGEEFGFTLDGVDFTPGHLSILDLGELAQFADLDVDTPEGLAKVTQFFALLLGDDFARFKEHCGRQHTKPDRLMEILTDLVADIFAMPDFPTQAARVSPPGQPSTPPMLRVVSLDGGGQREEPLTPQRIEELRRVVMEAETVTRQAAAG